MLVLRGGPALPRPRLDRTARAAGLSPDALDAREVFLVDLARPLEPAERRALEALVGAPAPWPRPEPDLLVVPRPGTVSPWSSKATDIARVCGLGGAVRRLERGVAWFVRGEAPPALREAVHDRMTEAVLDGLAAAAALFTHPERRPLRALPLAEGGRAALERADREWGLALAPEEVDYLLAAFRRLGRDPTDAELVMFAQANSEHCRHKIFNADWTIDGRPAGASPFALIRSTHARSPGGVLVAYEDNAAVFRGPEARGFWIDPATRRWGGPREPVALLAKVETHNHPTGISPAPGAATGNGGEIRDEAATGTGGRTEAGLCGFIVSDLHLPGWPRPWEADVPPSPRMAPALRIMLEAPIGGADYNNEFGRPGLVGFFRTFTLRTGEREARGYHKPVMLAGGLGRLRPVHARKRPVPPGAPIVVLGGPALLIGLGGGAASSMETGASDEELDFASVQRANPEVQRRCQEVIDRCAALGEDNPVLSIHDVGAGGLSNAVPELVHAAGLGAEVDLAAVPCGDPSMSPMERWCNEAQERYVLALDPGGLERFAALCRRERAPFAVIGRTTAEPGLRVADSETGEVVVDLPLEVVLGGPPRPRVEAVTAPPVRAPVDLRGWDPAEALHRVLTLPAVASKEFLVTIGDRSITGRVARDQMVGPWQVPVADCGVVLLDHEGFAGAALAVGERPQVALLDAAASARLAVAEALLNLLAADVGPLDGVVLSANWMAASRHPGELARLYEAVRALAEELCPALDLRVPVGKDSMSMAAAWGRGGDRWQVVAPMTLVVSAFSPVADARRTATPLLAPGPGTVLVHVDLSAGRRRLGGSALAQVAGGLGEEPANLDAPERLAGLWRALPRVRGRVLAWHDVSDGGIAVTLAEMAFASHRGVEADLDGDDALAALFAEEPGAVLQVRERDLDAVLDAMRAEGVPARPVGRPRDDDRVVFRAAGRVAVDEDRVALQRSWMEVTHRICLLRDDPDCAREALAAALDRDDPGLVPRVRFEVGAPAVVGRARPRVAVLREQGINGHAEMAAAFERAGFEAVDVHMTDVLDGDEDLSGYAGLVAPGGFSYGDVLGAGRGWAATVLGHPRARDRFAAFFARPDTFTLGVCNGCQFLAALKELIPGAEAWPRFERNRSGRFEARLVLLDIEEGPSVLLRGMAGSRLLVPVAHGEGRAVFAPGDEARALVAARYGDPRGGPAERHPYNPNGSPGGIAALTTPDGRATIMMPHPERAFRLAAHSWHPPAEGDDGPWMRLFRNARAWVG